MTTVRDAYVIGRTGSYFVPTIEKLDATIRQLTSKIADADPVKREHLWADIDRLLERRSRLAEEARCT